MILKELLPFEDYTLITQLSVADVQQRLADNIEPEKGFRFNIFKATKTFEGAITGDNFQITRIIKHRNSFKPFITGHIFTSNGKTHVRIRMRLYIVVLIFICLWLYGTGYFSIIIYLANDFKAADYFNKGFKNPSLLPPIMFGAVLIMTLLGFKIESKRSKRFLSSLLEEEK